ncbi:hypothetical protein [Aliivibrio kagoshimensis]|uniref:hypothetical protein n=1 Tax=Aliivibrio kagoshimensis TaxID=2910230 RepID=UPI003D10B8A9
MGNATDTLSTASRALIVGMVAGSSATVVSQWKSHQRGEISTNELVSKTAINAAKSGAIAGATTYVAEQMAGRPALSMLTILSVGAAGLYLMDQTLDKENEQ